MIAAFLDEILAPTYDRGYDMDLPHVRGIHGADNFPFGDHLTSLLVRIAGLVLVVIATEIALDAAGIHFWNAGLSWFLFALGVLTVGEVYWGYSGRSQRHEDVRHGLTEIGLLTASALVFVWILRPVVSPSGLPSSVDVKISEPVKIEFYGRDGKDVIDTSGVDDHNRSNLPNKIAVSVTFSDKAETDLSTFLAKFRNLISPAQSLSVPWVSLGAMAFALVILSVTLIKGGSRSAQTEVSLAALTAIVVAALGTLEKLPRVHGRPFGTVFWGPTIVGAVLIAFSVVIFFNATARGPDGNQDATGFQRWSTFEKFWHFAGTGLSFWVMAWVVLWAHEAPDQTTNVTRYEKIPLNQQVLFDRPGSTEVRDITSLSNEINSIAKPGDLLVLLGSTDCSSIVEGNTRLAGQRAGNVETELTKHELSAMPYLLPYAFPRLENCKPDPSARAVFSLLLRPEKETEQSKVAKTEP